MAADRAGSLCVQTLTPSILLEALRSGRGQLPGALLDGRRADGLWKSSASPKPMIAASSRCPKASIVREMPTSPG